MAQPAVVRTTRAVSASAAHADASILRLYCVLQGGKESDRLEGADVPGLTEKVTKLAAAGAAAPTKAPPAAAPVDVVTRIKALLSSSPVVLFMKGTAASPYCGFSRKVVDALTASGVQQFKDVDILKDEELRWVLCRCRAVIMAA
jgi:hypothetical protein